MKLALPQYSGKDNLVMIGSVPFFTLYINLNIFESQYLQHLGLFGVASVITGAVFVCHFVMCGFVAVLMKKRFPHPPEVLKRLTLMILVFLVMTGLFLFMMFEVYENFRFFGARIHQESFAWCYFSMGIINVFLTFLMEGISRYQHWKQNWYHNEELKTVFKERQLHSLKSQVNPHFLFDSLDKLADLVKQEGEEADVFLNALTKVYRYMLNTEEEKLVTLENELKFLHSFRYLLNARYGAALELDWKVNDNDLDKLLPPLSLHSIVENALSLKPVETATPLKIVISSTGDNHLVISYDINGAPNPALNGDGTLENLASNYLLIMKEALVIENKVDHRVIHLPLCKMEHKMEMMV